MRKAFNEAVTSIARNRFLSAVTIISIAFILLIFNVLLAVNQITQDTVNNLSDRITLTVYVEKDADSNKIENVLNDIRKLPFIHSALYQNADTSLKQIRQKYPESTEFLEKYEVNNPLPAIVNINTTNLEDQKKIIKLFENEPYSQLFRIDQNSTQQSTIRTVINNLINLKSFTFQVILWVILTFTIGGALQIFNILNVTLFNRRKEVQIMQFVGATHNTIKTPFVIEGILYGIISFFFSLLILAILQRLLPNGLANFQSILLTPQYQVTLLVEFIAIGIISGLISIFTVDNYLKSKSILSD